MVLGVNQTIGLVVVIISVIAYFTVKNSLNYTKESVRNLDENEDTLLVAITSAQENFERRQSIRRTWLKLVKNESLKYYFLVGKLFCDVPPRYRLSQFSCDEWRPFLGHDVTNETLIKTISKEEKCMERKHIGNAYTKGFSFILNHKIIIHHLGVNSDMLSKCSEPVRLILFDAVTTKRIVTATFSPLSNESGDFIWKKVAKAILPSGFEGQLLLEGECNVVGNDNSSASFTLSDKSNIIHFLLDIDNKNVTSPYVKDLCTNVGFRFSVADVKSIHKLIENRTKEYSNWRQYIKTLSDKLNTEISVYRDILLLNIIDVYHNLPMKMRLFYQWLNPGDYSYVMKTDDDVFVDLPSVIRELEMNDDKLWNWWSCFRKHWPVHRAGKWRELHLNLTVYPNFPSGAGYILGRKVVKYLKDNDKSLPLQIQGEDVALGLWVSRLKPKMHLGFHCQWSCSNKCKEDSCNVMELSVSDMFSVWEQFINCNNSLKCWCNQQ